MVQVSLGGGRSLGRHDTSSSGFPGRASPATATAATGRDIAETARRSATPTSGRGEVAAGADHRQPGAVEIL